jgi:hypothetical protein
MRSQRNSRNDGIINNGSERNRNEQLNTQPERSQSTHVNPGRGNMNNVNPNTNFGSDSRRTIEQQRIYSPQRNVPDEGARPNTYEPSRQNRLRADEGNNSQQPSRVAGAEQANRSANNRNRLEGESSSRNNNPMRSRSRL